MRPFHGNRLLSPYLRIKVSGMTESNSVKQLESSLFYICSACYSTLVLKSFRGIAWHSNFVHSDWNEAHVTIAVSMAGSHSAASIPVCPFGMFACTVRSWHSSDNNWPYARWTNFSNKRPILITNACPARWQETQTNDSRKLIWLLAFKEVRVQFVMRIE